MRVRLVNGWPAGGGGRQGRRGSVAGLLPQQATRCSAAALCSLCRFSPIPRNVRRLPSGASGRWPSSKCGSRSTVLAWPTSLPGSQGP